MADNRDEFSSGVKTILAHRAGYRCSKPSCRALTAGPSNQARDSLTNVGVASHITGASRGGPRFEPTMTSEERRSVTNGIWMCQTHGKEIDDDPVRFTSDVLKAWKRHAEEDAQSLLGKPISAQALDVMIQVALHRADDNTLMVTGNTNLPNGMKFMVNLRESGTGSLLGQVEATTNEGMLAAAGFANGGDPHPHTWYTVEVVAYFNAWRQSEAVMSIVGREGAYLVGRFAEPLHPEFSESEKRLRAAFECVGPPVKTKASRSAQDLQRAVTFAQHAVLLVDDSLSALPVAGVIEMFMETPDLREHEGWSAHPLANGAVVVKYSFWNGEETAVAEWIVILDTEEVRYWNVHGKLMSWAPDY